MNNENQQQNMPNIDSASVKVMRSYDYCHFEVCLSATISGDANSDIVAVDNLRKTAARLADKAVEQYKIAKDNAQKLLDEKQNRQWVVNEAHRIEKIPEGDRSVREQADLKAFLDEQWEQSRQYDYEDDWSE